MNAHSCCAMNQAVFFIATVPDIHQNKPTFSTQLKLVRRLQRRREREEERAFVVEGEDLVLAGLETDAPVRVLLVDAERVPDLDPSLVPCPVVHVEPKLLAEVIRELDARGIEIDDLGLRRPTLDDVFLSLTGHVAEAKAEAEAEKSEDMGQSERETVR